MNRNVLSLVLITSLTAAGCSQSDDSCDDLNGTITHTTTEIVGIESASVLKRNTVTNALEAVDQINGTEYSNLIVDLKLSWVEEQHRLGSTNTFIQSFLNWLIPPAMACSLAPYYEDYQPAVSTLQIISDSDFNEIYTAGSDLTQLFIANGMMGESDSLFEANSNGALASARTYSLQPAWINGELAAIPTTPTEHIFTIMISLDDGSAFEFRTPAVLLSGI